MTYFVDREDRATTPPAFISNGLARWINNYTETVPIALNRPVRVTDLRSVVLTTTFGGGIGGDNWNMDALRVLAGDRVLFDQSGAPLCRFTGANRPFTAALRA